jgi:hypothetical protein
MTIRQFSAHWNPLEDRIFLRFNTHLDEEYRLWLTRTLIGQLFEQAADFIRQSLSKKHDARIIALVEDFQKQRVNQHVNAGQAFQEGQKRPLGDNPVLVIALKLSVKNETHARLTMQLASKKKLDIPLNLQTLQSMVYLVERLQKQAQWSLSLDVNGNQGTVQGNEMSQLSAKQNIH